MTPAPGTPGNIPDVITTPKTKKGRVLLPYQTRWVNDQSRLKAWEKSRRIGADYTEAYDVAMSRYSEKRNEDYWYSSADESAAYEFAEYVRHWVKTFGKVLDAVRPEEIDGGDGKKITAFVVRFPNGKRMTAMSSNPRRFRSKGGDVGLSELAFHDDERAIYDASIPCITWGGRLRILTTHNGEDTFFNREVVQPAKRRARGETVPGLKFSVHTVTIVNAVEDGLVEKINEMKGTNFTREEFLENCRAMCRNEDQFNQEYMAIPSTNSSAWLPYELIERCEHEDAGKPELFSDGPRYLGQDIGENNDPSCSAWGERVGDVMWVRELVRQKGIKLYDLQAQLLERLNHPRTVRGVIDGTGLGTQIGQEAERTGKGESVKFTLPTMDQMASPLRGVFEDVRIRIPKDRRLRESLHSVRCERLASGAVRFVAPRSDDGHADDFWAIAMMMYAARITGQQFHSWMV